MSFSTFGLRWASPPHPQVNAGDDSQLELTVSNIGGRVGDVVIACYAVLQPSALVPRPPRRQLFAFDRVEDLAPGGEAALAFSLGPAGRSLVTSAGRRIVPTGRCHVVCEAGGPRLTVSAQINVTNPEA